MREALPDFIDPKRQAAGTGFLEGVWPADQCPRVTACVSRFLDDAALELRFTQRTTGEVDIDGRLNVGLELLCQRCLKPMRWTIDEPLCVTAVAHAAPDPAAEDRDVIELDARGLIAVGRWIEDEVLLRIPLAPKHAEIRECNPEVLKRTREVEPEQQTDADNPFSILKHLK